MASRCWLAVAPDGHVNHIVHIEHPSARLIRKHSRPVQQGFCFVEVCAEHHATLQRAYRVGALRFERAGYDNVVLGRRGRVTGLDTVPQ